jgi:hypothetical protein
MLGERGQSGRVVVRVSVDVVVAVAIYDAASGRRHSSTIPRDHRMPKLPQRSESRRDAFQVRLMTSAIILYPVHLIGPFQATAQSLTAKLSLSRKWVS